MGRKRVVRARRIVQVETRTDVAVNTKTVRVTSFGKKKRRRGAHDEEDDSKATTDVEKVTSERVRRACGTFRAIVSRGIDSREECSRYGERQDTARGHQRLPTTIRVNLPKREERVIQLRAMRVELLLPYSSAPSEERGTRDE